MEGGQIIQSGSFEELLATGTAFEQLVNAHKGAVTELVSSDIESKSETLNTGIDQLEDCDRSPTEEKTRKEEISVDNQLTKEEERVIGDVGIKPLLDYLHVSKGFLLLSLVILSRLAFAVLQAGASYWMALAIRNPKISSVILVGVYTGISLFSTPFVYLRSIFTELLGLKASKAFFSGINNSLFKAPMLFFDSTPVGRIYTRVNMS